MGYIIPFNHYQYNQYAKREEAASKDYDPYRFQPIVKAMLRNKRFHEPKENKYEFLKGDANDLPLKNEVSDEVINSTLAELEGKGQYFNEYI